MTPAEMRAVNQKIRKAIETEDRLTRIEGCWWPFSLTERTAKEPSTLGLLKISRDRGGVLEMTGRERREVGRLSARSWSVAAQAQERYSGLFVFAKGVRPLDPDAPHTGKPQWQGRGCPNG